VEKVNKLKEEASSQKKKISEMETKNKSLQERACVRSDNKDPSQKLLALQKSITNQLQDKISNQ
jgi:hypothetical protein